MTLSTNHAFANYALHCHENLSRNQVRCSMCDVHDVLHHLMQMIPKLGKERLHSAAVYIKSRRSRSRG